MTPEELEELLRRMRQQEQEQQHYPDEDGQADRKRYFIREHHISHGLEGLKELYTEVGVHDLDSEGGHVESYKIWRQLEDGSILHDEKQLKKVGRCEVVLEDGEEPITCGVESLVETCSNCGRKCCRLHRVRMVRQQENPPELMEAMGRLPEAVIEQLIAGRWVCHTCMLQTQVQIDEVDRRARWQRRIQGFIRFITAMWREEY